MPIFVHVTEQCRRQAARHNWQDRLENFAAEIEKKQTTRMFQHFPPPYLVKKKFGEFAGRLIAAQEPINNPSGDSVVVFLAAMIKGTADYKAFGNNAQLYGRQHFDELYSEDELKKLVEERTREAPPPPKPSITEEEYGYLHGVFSHTASKENGQGGEEDLVVESPDWVERCSEPAFRNYHAFLHAALCDAEAQGAGAEEGGAVISVAGRPTLSVFLKRFPRQRVLWLGAPIINSDASAVGRLRQKYSDVLSPDVDIKVVIQASRRAYPSVVLADDNLWMELQKETHANMALSPEESRVLRSVRRTTDDAGNLTGGFPLFINGRAGSGKTTILQYLFAEFLFYHLTQGKAEAPPVYFTYNTELLRNSRAFVIQLLRCGAQWWHYGGDRDELIQNNESLFDHAFKHFQVHLLSLVEPGERAVRFPANKYIGYSRFISLWTQRFGHSPNAGKDFGPEISWHVIRSYIKGLDSDDFLSADEYQHLDRKQLSVTQHTYAHVYQNVWQNWYRTLGGEGFWDDQDLARYLIDRDDQRREGAGVNATSDDQTYGLRPVHPAIFCDEAQDFTRVELEVILRMSLFGERSVDRDEVVLVPFVFAGDQFQTLNPTGFRWESIKAFFVEKFILALTSYRPPRVDLNYRELSYNYRSSRSIVRFSNYVQALRARLFDLASLKPQQPWEFEENPPPVMAFVEDNDELWAQLQQASDLVIIVPCGENEESAFVEADPILRKRIGFNEDGSLRMTVISAVGAKGLEFPRVAVFGFGKNADEGLLGPIREGSPSYAADLDRALPLQYFVNRLYVAVSRAKKRLFIIDSSEGFRKLWNFAQSQDLEAAILDGLKDGHEIWSKAIARLEQGRPKDIASDQVYDPMEIANSLAADGRARSYAPHLLQAATIYQNNGNDKRAMRCRADAAKIEAKFLKAADLFLRCGEMHEAVSCYWGAQREGWKALTEAAREFPDLIERLEYNVARAIEGEPSLKEITQLFQRLSDSLKNEQMKAEVTGTAAWVTAVQTLLGKIENRRAEPNEWIELFNIVERVVQAGLHIESRTRGQLAYKAGQLARAFKIWDEAGEKGSPEYRIAKAFAAPYPEKLGALYEIGRYREIVQEFEANPTLKLSAEQQGYVGRAYVSNGIYSQALPLLVRARDVGGLTALIIAGHKSDPEIAVAAGAAAFAAAALNDDWSSILPYVAQGSFSDDLAQELALRRWIEQNKNTLDLALMRAVARSDSIATLSWTSRRDEPTQRPFAEYLLRSFFPQENPLVEEKYIIELGAAIERSGNRTGALRYYEMVGTDRRFSKEIPIHARERWIASKERQAQFAEKEGDKRTAAAQRKEADRERRALGMKPTDKLPSFPELSSLEKYLEMLIQPSEKLSREGKSSEDSAAEAIEETDGTTIPKSPGPTNAGISGARKRWTLGPLSVEYFEDSKRLNIDDKAGARVAVRPSKNVCASEDVEVRCVVGDSNRFTVEDWGLSIDLTDPAVVTLSVNNHPELRIPIL